ncbi:MAG: transcriptional repressor [bacterium]
MKLNILKQKVNEAGGRITKVRLALLNLLLDTECLMTLSDLKDGLIELQVHPDRSTLFRELNYLEKINIISQKLLDGIEYYELKEGKHHHHLICENCKKIQKVELDKHLGEQEVEIAARFKFKIKEHQLEFYGLCEKCEENGER